MPVPSFAPRDDVEDLRVIEPRGLLQVVLQAFAVGAVAVLQAQQAGIIDAGGVQVGDDGSIDAVRHIVAHVPVEHVLDDEQQAERHQAGHTSVAAQPSEISPRTP
ncbi:MAG: hypothetical protein IPH86_11950 [bacterium]|nr:hypothetical protein [bacterium]